MEEEQATAKKLAYVSPVIEIHFVEMEQGIAAGSAAVTPVNSSSQVLEEWEIGTDREGDTPW